MTKRVLSLLLIIMLVASSTALGEESTLTSAESTIPIFESLVHGDDFEDNTYNSKLVVSNVTAGSFEVSDGKAKLTRSSSSGNSFIRFYGTENQTDLSGEYYFETTVKRTKAVPVMIRSYDATGKWGQVVTAIDWRADGSLLYYNGSSIATLAATTSRKSGFKIGIYTNSETNKYSVWLDGELVVDKADVRNSTGISGFRYIQFYMESTNYATLEFEDYNIYKVVPTALTDEESVYVDSGKLTLNSLLTAPLADEKYLIDSLSLPTIGEKGSSIVWTSSDKSVIAANGVVSRPLISDAEVTLTATVTKGSVSRTVDFPFTVAALKSQPAQMPALMGVVHGDDFEDGTFDSTLLANNVSGGSIGVEDGKLAFTRSSSGETFLRFYMTKNKKETADKKYYMEFVTSRTKAVNVLTRSYDAVGTYGQNLTAIDWAADGAVSYYDGATNHKLAADSSRVSDMKWGILIDTVADTYSLWLDNTLVLEDIHVRVEDSSGFRYLQFYMDGSNYTTLNFESYRIYNVWEDMEDSERVALDSDSVRYENLLTKSELAPGIINADLILPIVGANGTEIIWESSNENIIATNGSVTCPDSDGFYEVTLNATIKSGEVSSQKTFEFIVPGSNTVIETDIGTDELVCFNDFESDNTDNRISHSSRNYTDVFCIKNGKYEVTRTGNTTEATYVRMYPTSSSAVQNALQGVVAVEFDMAKSANEILKAVLTSSEGGYLTVEWQESGNVILGQRTNADDTVVSWLSVNRSFSNDGGINVKVLLDTRRQLYSLWLNGEMVIKNHYSRSAACDNYLYTEFTSSSSDGFIWTVDNHKVYYAIPPQFMRADYDFCSVTRESILTAPPVLDNIIDAPLNLYTELDYGSEVRWESSRPDVINPDTGVLTRPVDTDSDIPVTVTAFVTNSGIERSVSFDFVVMREFSGASDTEKGDLARLDYSLLTSENPSEITHYLNLMNKGIYGSDISWESSDENHITPSGRVIRPKWDESPATVILTATVADKYTKDFTFVVLPDEKPTDKQTFTDEDFFGVWNGSEWTDEPSLNYEYTGLEKVGTAVKNGDYSLAEEELLTYMKARNVKSPVSLPGRNAPWVNSLVTGLADMQSASYYIGEGSVKTAEYEKISVPISNMNISFADVKNYDIIAKHNDTTEIIIAGTEFADEDMRPTMKLYVNGSPRYYKAVQTSSVRTGAYKNTHVDNNEELKVKMFGEFLGDETYRTMLMFDFDDIKDTDTIGSGELIFYAKKSTDYSEDKEFFVLKDPFVEWDEKTVCWNDLKTYVHNFNGIPGGNHWQDVDGTDVEYAYQSCRFYGYDEMLREYLYSGDEIYAYTLIQRMMDFLNDSGSVGKYAWPRTLDTSVRLEAWIAMYNYIVDLKWVDAEINTAIIKNMHKAMWALINSGATTANWIQSEKTFAYNTAVLFPEFADSADVKQRVIDHFTNSFYNEYYPDGAYIEDTGSYHTGAFSKYINARNMIVNGGGEVSAEYDELLRRGAYYVLLLRGPGGENLAYGDSGTGGATTNEKYSSLSERYNDMELKYIDTFGEKGTKPSWTSAHLPYSTYTFMRSDWSKTASYLFTNVRNGGTHGHNDDNGVIVFAKGKNFLVDAGYVTYSSGTERSMAVSTNGHNTVSINDENHKSVTGYDLMYGNQGDVHNWTTTPEYDFLSQTTKGYTHIGNNHRRTITFVKPGFWIVSDLCTPDDKTKVNNYKQNWHMLPSSGVTVDENNVFSTNFTSGANIKVATVDDDAVPVLTEGVYTSTYGQAVDNPWAYYEKEVSGDASFDTVLLPYDGVEATINTERIELFDPETGTSLTTSEATAFKFASSTSDGERVVYYMLNYNPDGKQLAFDKYKSDAMLTVVVEDKFGNVEQIILNGGTNLTTKDGKPVEEMEYPVYNIIATTANGGYTADFYCIKDDADYPDADCIFALYDGNKFITFKTDTIKHGASDASSPAVSLKFDANEIPSDAKNVRVKAFVWKDNTLIPITVS